MESILAKRKFTKAMGRLGVDLKSEDGEFIVILILAHHKIEELVGSLSYSYPMLTWKKAYKIAKETKFSTLDPEVLESIKILDSKSSEIGLEMALSTIVDLSDHSECIAWYPYYCTDLIADMYENESQILWDIQSNLMQLPKTKVEVEWTKYKMMPSHRFFAAPFLGHLPKEKLYMLAQRNLESQENSFAATVLHYELQCRSRLDYNEESIQGPKSLTDLQARLITMGLVETDLIKYKAPKLTPSLMRTIDEARKLGLPVLHESLIEEPKLLGLPQTDEIFNQFTVLKNIINNTSYLINSQIERTVPLTYASPLILDRFKEGKYKTTLAISLHYTWLRYKSEANKKRSLTFNESKNAPEYISPFENVSDTEAEDTQIEQAPKQTKIITELKLTEEQKTKLDSYMQAYREVFNATLDAIQEHFQANKNRRKVVNQTRVVTEIRKKYPELKRGVLTRAHNLAVHQYTETGRELRPQSWSETKKELFIKSPSTLPEQRKLKIEDMGIIEIVDSLPEGEIRHAVIKQQDGKYQIQLQY